MYGFDGGQASSFGPFMVHPFWVLYRYLDGLAIMLFYRDGQGVSFNLDNDSEYLNGLFSTCFGLLILHWFIWFVLWLYALNVVNIGDGTRKSPLFFLDKAFWGGMCGSSVEKQQDLTKRNANRSAGYSE